jgi:rod shape-determining protein MreD
MNDIGHKVFDVFLRNAWKSIPLLLTLFFVFVSGANNSFNFSSQVNPTYLLMMAYFWSVQQPWVMSFGSFFIFGIVYDTLAGSPIGFTSLMLMLSVLLFRTRSSVLLRQPFVVHWIVFAIFCTVYNILSSTFLAVYYHQPVRNSYLFSEIAITICIYPLVHWLMMKINRSIFFTRYGHVG